MTIDAHSVVYFINEEYGVVIKANGKTREVSVWENEKGFFARRIDYRLARFLVRTNRKDGHWCVAHPTYDETKAVSVAKRMVSRLPNETDMRLAREAKLEQVRCELREKGCEWVASKLAQGWQAQELAYA